MTEQPRAAIKAFNDSIPQKSDTRDEELKLNLEGNFWLLPFSDRCAHQFYLATKKAETQNLVTTEIRLGLKLSIIILAAKNSWRGLSGIVLHFSTQSSVDILLKYKLELPQNSQESNQKQEILIEIVFYIYFWQNNTIKF